MGHMANQKPAAAAAGCCRDTLCYLNWHLTVFQQLHGAQWLILSLPQSNNCTFECYTLYCIYWVPWPWFWHAGEFWRSFTTAIWYSVLWSREYGYLLTSRKIKIKSQYSFKLKAAWVLVVVLLWESLDQASSRHLFQPTSLWFCGSGLLSPTTQSIFLISLWGLLHSWVEPEVSIYFFPGHFCVSLSWFINSTGRGLCLYLHLERVQHTLCATQKSASQETATVLQLCQIIWRFYTKKLLNLVDWKKSLEWVKAEDVFKWFSEHRKKNSEYCFSIRPIHLFCSQQSLPDRDNSLDSYNLMTSLSC